VDLEHPYDRVALRERRRISVVIRTVRLSNTRETSTMHFVTTQKFRPTGGEMHEPFTSCLYREQRHRHRNRGCFLGLAGGSRSYVVGVGSDRSRARIQGERFNGRQGEIPTVCGRSVLFQLFPISGSRGRFLGPLHHLCGKISVVDGLVRFVREEGVSRVLTVPSDQAETRRPRSLANSTRREHSTRSPLQFRQRAGARRELLLQSDSAPSRPSLNVTTAIQARVPATAW
jgi:hypothetical protein